MKSLKKVNIIILLFIICLAYPAGGKTNVYKMAVGFSGGTYEQTAMALNKLPDINVKTINTKGSIDIMKKINAGEAQLGIAQMDIILNAYQDKSIFSDKVMFLLPLYSEEVHILAGRDIKSINDLQNKTVSIGDKFSGTAGTAEIILKETEILKKVKKLVYMETGKSISALMAGKTDAVFIVSGAPVKLLSDLPEETGKNYHLVPIDYSLFEKMTDKMYHYKKALIRKGTYAWQKKSIGTLSVVSSIIVSSSVSNKKVEQIIDSIFSNRQMLAKEHPKWSELNDDTIKWYVAGRSWRFHPAAARKLISILNK